VPANSTQSSRQRGAGVQPCCAADQEQELRSAVENFVDDVEVDSREQADGVLASLQAQLSDAIAQVCQISNTETHRVLMKF